MQQIQYYSCGSGGCGLLLQDTLDDLNAPKICSQLINKDQKTIKMKFSGLVGLIKEGDKMFIYGQWVSLYVIPKEINLIQSVSKFSCGWQHCLILTDKGLYGLGSNKFNELGLAHKQIFEEPQQIAVDHTKISNLTCGFRQSFIIQDECIFGVGQNKQNELNISNIKIVEQFTKINIQRSIKKIKCGQKFTLALSNDNSLYGWGSNSFGQLSQEPQLQILEEQELMKNVQDFDCGWSHHVILTKNGQVYICGRGDLGQQGDNKKQHNYNYQLIDLKATQVRCGSESTIIINQDKQEIYVSGWNEHGNLGLGHNNNVYQFEIIEMIQSIKAKGATILLSK
ncbi:unnamed protein product (macronuclear) [Paramecium tetraurelia]|uniref:RCC1-like domain-containing protein n=1 Tax=Paramecium tetraurelia TaxID=5888 RepID=A0BWY3_PARTE|nr:uncharacterized protein GSPATT00032902001 [Paramecium tetraurelia]CAK63050.1 unnamed protein product [Paramecium tetraurelia]|eukprot:XP_001430448.1 hypothetical protein (macronuclear) [Paramecium tetraurelia strain d4-2]